jgi:hypothetical protein
VAAAREAAAVVPIHPVVLEVATQVAAVVLLQVEVVAAVHQVGEVLHPDVVNSICSKLMVELKLFMP